MKHSGVEWIGMIPDDWKIVSVGDICKSAKSGGTPSSKNEDFYCDNESGTPWVAIGDISSCSEVYDTAKHVTAEGIKDKKLTIYPVGTILYSMYASLGHVAELMVPATVNQAILAMQIDESKINKNYFKQALNAFKPFVYEIATKNTQPNLNMEKVLNIKIPLPPLDQQELIAGYLDEQSRKQSLLKHSDLITQLKNYKTSIISEYVTGKKSLDNKPVAMKDSGIDWIGEIPAHWEVKKIEALVDILDNQRKPVSAGDRTSGEYPYWGAGKIMDYVDDYIFDGEYILLGEDGAPFFDKTRPVAHAVDGKFWANNHIHVLKAKNIVDRKFIVACLNSVNYKDFIKGAIIPKLNQATMRQLLIPVPPLSEQEAIAAKLDAVITEVDSVVANSEKIVAELKAYKSAVITEFITGQKLVPGFNSAERESKQ